MLKFSLKKLLAMIPMALIISFLIYLGLELTPGDAVSYMIPPDQLANVSAEKLEAIREAYGLNDPFIIRYFRWLIEMVQGNFGFSPDQRRADQENYSGHLSGNPGTVGCSSADLDLSGQLSGHYQRDTPADRSLITR